MVRVPAKLLALLSVVLFALSGTASFAAPNVSELNESEIVLLSSAVNPTERRASATLPVPVVGKSAKRTGFCALHDPWGQHASLRRHLLFSVWRN